MVVVLLALDMKVTAVLFLSLCFFLFKGYDSIYKRLHYGTHHSIIAQQIDKKKLLNTEVSNHKSILTNHNSVSEKKEDFLSVEDDDEDIAIARKYVLLTNYYITLAYVSVFILFCRQLKSRLPFGSQLLHTSSNKYILQRSLRI
ncbi:hypothetical protein ACVWYN_002337 [Pedobacter sp. UYP24]